MADELLTKLREAQPRSAAPPRKMDVFCQKNPAYREAILEMSARGCTAGHIADVLTEGGFQVGISAVTRWLRDNAPPR